MRAEPTAPQSSSHLDRCLPMSIALLAACLACGGVVSLLLGQDANWDLKNYHFYDPWSFQHERLNTDLFAAGIQTYFSPLLDLPYYYLSTGPFRYWPRLLAFVMGLPFGCLLFVSFQVTWIVSRGVITHVPTRIILCLAATGFGCSGVVDVIQIGTTFNEVPLAALVLAGLWLMLLHAEHPDVWDRQAWSLVLSSGLLFGLAAALKFTAVIYAPGIGLICLLLPGGINRRLLRAALFTLAWIVVVLGLWAPWGAKVYHLTSNPLFPMFNSLFRSPWAAPIGGRDLHAMPSSIEQAIFYPFYWIRPGATVVELEFADPRYAVVFLSVIILCLAGLGLHFRKAGQRPQKTTACLVFYVVVTYCIWEALFSILRYTVALESLAGALVLLACGTLYRAMHFRRAGQIAVGALVAMSAGAIYFSEYPNFGRAAYGKTVWQVDAPALPPGSTVILTDQPMAFVAPFIAQTSPNASFIGLPYYLDSSNFFDYELGRRVRKRIAAASALYIVDSQDRPPPLQRLSDFGVRPDLTSCRVISTNLSPGLNICEAQRIRPGSDLVATKFKIVPEMIANTGGIDLSMQFSHACTQDTSPEVASLAFSTHPTADKLAVYLQTPPGPRALFTTSPGYGVATTGPWITGGLHIIFTNQSGQVLAEYALQYEPCG